MDIEGLYQCQYRTINFRPVLYLCCRDSNGQKNIHIVENILPYCYINKEVFNDTEQNEVRFERVEEEQPKTIFGHECVKCYFKHPAQVYKIRQIYGYNNTYEADLLFDLRYIIDKIDDIKKTDYKILTFDIETDCLKGFPEWLNPVEHIICISAHDNYSNKNKTFVLNTNNQKVDTTEDISVYEDEKDMLEAFIDYWYKQDADIVTAWNLGFDIKYFIARCRELNINTDKLSCFDNSQFTPYYKNIIEQDIPREENLNGTVLIRTNGEVEILGLVLFDMLSAYRKMHFGDLTSYSLNNIAMLELEGEEKEKVYNTGDVWRKDINKLISYNRKDVDLVVRIEQKCKLISIFEDIKNFAGVRNINDCFFASRIHETRIMKKYRDRVFPNKPPFKEKTRDTMIQGAFVKEPKPGLYEDVICLDAKSLYPSIIYTFNLSTEMVSETEGSLINGIRIIQKPKGIMPSMIKELIELKDRMKKEVAGTGQDISDKMFAIKTFINSFYGINSLTNFRLYNKAVAENITFIGRHVTTTLSNMIEERYQYPVVYNDTDSMFIKIIHDVGDEEKRIKFLIDKGKEVQDFVNNQLPGIVKELGGDITDSNMFVEFEKIYRRILFSIKAGNKGGGAKKKYAGLIVWADDKIIDKVKVAGMHSRKSDVSPFSKELQNMFFESILRGKSKDDAIREILEMIDKLLDNKYSKEFIAIPTKLNKNIEEYPNQNIPKLRGVKWSNKNIGTSFSSGTKFKMLYVKHPETDSVCFEDEEQIEGIKPDWNKMVDKLIFQKVETIFISLDWKKVFEQLKFYTLNKITGQRTLF